MSDPSPIKRRRTRGSLRLHQKKVALSWSPNLLPVEIFTLIIAYLPRSSIQSMRLVSKEFEEKVSEYLFRVVVVPFKPEIYGITPEPSLGVTPAAGENEMLKGSVMLQDKGMRVFQGFGRRIRKFAMSFEFDEKKLANPPIKSDQEAITAFWGIYRWPFKNYNRYSQLEGLEQTADETRTMAKALRYIEHATELGLSIDGGLGWLAGPDVNRRVLDRGDRVIVFGESRFVPEPKPKTLKGGKSSKQGAFSERSDTAYALFEKMLQEAGYHGETLDQSVRMLLETEDFQNEPPTHQMFENLSSAVNWDNLSSNNLAAAIAESNSGTATDPGDLSTLDAYNTDEEEEENEIVPATARNKAKIKSNNFLLKPNDLSTAQREMLLEIEWAQRAFMQSYAIAIIDNPLTFQSIEALTIARLPSRHLPILRREDFWESLPQLNRLSLGIIPDWREVVKLPTSWVQDIRLVPSQSISAVYQILRDQISRRENIKQLHFEWLCGGEEAPGLFARNQNILAAPLVLKSMDMLSRLESPSILSLPYVEKLSLKNCWISPHILSRFGLSFRKGALQSILFDSVSLTAPVPAHLQPVPVAGALFFPPPYAVNQDAGNVGLNFQQGLAPGQNPQAPPPAGGTNPDTNPDWIRPPRPGSWASIIETLTPASTLAQQRYRTGISRSNPPSRNTANLTKLEFKSCGYVRLLLGFDQTMLDAPGDPTPQVNTIMKRLDDLEPFMMKAHDPTVGTIVNHIDICEVRTLENGFLLSTGWGPARAALSLEAAADGITTPGQGRFDGIIETNRGATSGR